MNKKRLTHDKWGFTGFPYYQLRIDTERFHGAAALIDLNDGDFYYWDMPIAGKVPVCGRGMLWLELIPDGQHRVITAKFLPKNADGTREIAIWYVDVIEETITESDGVLAFIDKYLDVIFTPQGDVKVDDRDQLDDALKTGDITRAQYEAALAEGESILSEQCGDIGATEQLTKELLDCVLRQIELGQTTLAHNTPKKLIFLDIDGVLDTFNPNAPRQELKESALQSLKTIVDATNARIVVISSWRFGSKLYPDYQNERYKSERDGCQLLEEKLAEYDLEVFDITPCAPELTTRTMEVKAYLSKRRDVESFVILDDCFHDDFKSDSKLYERLIFVNCGPCLTQTDAQTAIEILGRKYIK